jgi:iron complex outermembrane receptor protein
LLDASLFYNEYDDLRTTEPVAFKPFPPPPTLLTKLENQMFGELYGLELAAHWQALTTWKLIGTYSYLQTFLHTQSSSRDTTTATQLERNTPHHQASLRSLWSLPQQVEFDTAWYYVDNVPNQHAAHYTRFDARLGWRPWPALELSLGGRNLLDKQHLEFGNGENGIVPTEVPRAFYLQLKYRF